MSSKKSSGSRVVHTISSDMEGDTGKGKRKAVDAGSVSRAKKRTSLALDPDMQKVRSSVALHIFFLTISFV